MYKPFLTGVLCLSISLLAACGGGSSSASNTATNSSPTATQGNIQNISNDELQSLVDKGVTLIDIRRPEEWKQTGIVPGSKMLTLFTASGGVNPEFPKRIKQVAPPDKPVILICRTGNRTHAGAQILAQTGYSKVYNVTRGITHWIASGNKVNKL